jgi:hypothetical protein
LAAAPAAVNANGSRNANLDCSRPPLLPFAPIPREPLPELRERRRQLGGLRVLGRESLAKPRACPADEVCDPLVVGAGASERGPDRVGGVDQLAPKPMQVRVDVAEGAKVGDEKRLRVQGLDAVEADAPCLTTRIPAVSPTYATPSVSSR